MRLFSSSPHRAASLGLRACTIYIQIRYGHGSKPIGSPFGRGGAPPILVDFSGDWDVRVLTHGHMGVSLFKATLACGFGGGVFGSPKRHPSTTSTVPFSGPHGLRSPSAGQRFRLREQAEKRRASEELRPQSARPSVTSKTFCASAKGIRNHLVQKKGAYLVAHCIPRASQHLVAVDPPANSLWVQSGKSEPF